MNGCAARRCGDLRPRIDAVLEAPDDLKRVSDCGEIGDDVDALTPMSSEVRREVFQAPFGEFAGHAPELGAGKLRRPARKTAKQMREGAVRRRGRDAMNEIGVDFRTEPGGRDQGQRANAELSGRSQSRGDRGAH